MIKKQRIPTMSSSLHTILSYGVDVKAVIDVGILNGTPPLMTIFPHIKQYLFEPIESHFETIKKSYKNIDYELFNIALSDKDSESYLVGISADRNNSITHSHISETPITQKQDPRVVSCQQIRKAKLDTVLEEIIVESPFLLKIDVDGHEIPILCGAEKSLGRASIVIIEAPLQKTTLPALLERFQHMLGMGFILIDIVDFAYYNGILWQVDLIFIQKDIVNNIEELRPFETSSFKFNRELWYPLTKKLFNE